MLQRSLPNLYRDGYGTPTGCDRSPHPLGSGVVLLVPDLPAPPGRAARRVLAPARSGSVLRPLPARRADGRRRRLPPGAARRGRAPAPPGRQRPVGHGAVVHPHGRVPRVRRDHRARPAARSRASGCLQRRHASRLPPRHVRPHRPDAPAAPPGRPRPCGRLAWRAERHRQDRLLVVSPGRFNRAGGIPRRRVRQRGGDPQ